MTFLKTTMTAMAALVATTGIAFAQCD